LSGKRDLAAGPVEKAHPEIVFECLDLKRHGGLRKEELFRCLVKVQVLRNSAEHLETKILELRHVTIIHEARAGRSSSDEYHQPTPAGSDRLPSLRYHQDAHGSPTGDYPLELRRRWSMPFQGG